MVIVVGGMIGTGKTTIAKLIGEHYGAEVFYEEVQDNPLLKEFYTASEADSQKYRYPFLLQLYFLDKRFKAIKSALYDNNNVIDRSIYEDKYFAKVNTDLGRISKQEFSIYEGIFDNMMEELNGVPKKAPDLMVYLKCSFETVVKHIQKRGRSFETKAQLNYFKQLWSGYDEWIEQSYKASDVLVINMDEIDVVESEKDRKVVLDMLDKKLKIDTKEDVIAHPKHYAENKRECIQAMELAFGKEAVAAFCKCNHFKYHWRMNEKNGVEDANKAEWYSKKYKELTGKEIFEI